MSIQSGLRQELLIFLAQIPGFNNRKGRQALLLNAGLGEVEHVIDWEGSSKEFLALLIDQLDRYGTLSNGQNALLTFLDGLSTDIGIDRRETLKLLRDRLVIDNITVQTFQKNPEIIKKVFVSSTIEDLIEVHEAVRNEIEQNNRLEYLGSLKERTEPSREEISVTDLFIGIYAQSYGQILKDGKSIIEQEYDIAQELGKKRICFVLSEDAFWKVKFIDTGEKADKLLAFKKRLSFEENAQTFNSKLEIISLIREVLESYVQSESITIEDLHSANLNTIESLYCKKIAAAFNQFPTLDPNRRLTIVRDYIHPSFGIWDESKEELQDIDLIFNKRQHVVVLGLPGTGKTTLLHYLVFREALKTKVTIPIYIRLARFSMTNDEISDYLLKELKQYIGKNAAEKLAFSETFLDERYIVLLDGLDEVKKDDYEEIVRKIHGFAAEYRHCKIVITSRLASFNVDTFEGWLICQLKPLTLERIQHFIENWFKDTSKNIDPLVATIQSNDRLLELAQIPFLLVMICHTYENEGHIYEVRSRLYQRSVEYMLGLYDWDPERQNTVYSEQRQQFQMKVDLLSQIAFHFFQLSQKEFTREELELVLKMSYGRGIDTAGLITDFIKSGIIQFAGDYYFFLHRTIWEFFVALAIKDRILDEDEIAYRATNAYWEEPLRLYAGLITVHEVAQAYIEKLWRYNKPLALRATLELGDGSARLLSQIVVSSSVDDRLLLIASLKSPNYELVGAKSRLAIESLQALFAIEQDCQVLYEGMELLKKLDPTDQAGIIRDKLDLGNAKQRLLKFLKAPQYLLDFVEINGGDFQMGNPDDDRDNDKPVHSVRVSSFCVSKYPVTNKLFREFPFLNNTYSEHYLADNDKPVTRVTWFEANIFSKWLGCRLLTEAEWEYACRAGTQTRYFFGNDATQLANYGWYYENSSGKVHKVGEKEPNSFGLFDIVGNIWDMCQDWYDASYYSFCLQQGIVIDPSGPAFSEYVVHRGGSFNDNAGKLRSGYRSSNLPKVRSVSVGFRLCFPGSLGELLS